MKILIPNATGPTNIGDQAILSGLLKLVESAYNDLELIIHSSTPEKYQNFKYPVKPHLYHWSVYEKPNVISRAYRVTLLLLQYSFVMAGIRINVGPKELVELLDDYRRADLIIFVGGGYLRTNPGLKQSLNLLMLLLHFSFAKAFKKKIIVAPMSFGPFAKKWQEKLSARILNGLICVGVREKISYDILKKYNLNNLLLSADQALLIENLHSIKQEDKFILGFTVRNWNSKDATDKNARIVAQAIIEFSKIAKIVVQPIVQVSSMEYGDEDPIGARNISNILRERGLNVKEVVVLVSVPEAVSVYSQIDMIIGMRMHSNIIAATQLKPFLAIAYEHKTKGICEMLGMGAYCLDYGHFTADELLSALVKLYKNRSDVTDNLRINLSKIQQAENDKWKGVLSGLTKPSTI